MFRLRTGIWQCCKSRSIQGPATRGTILLGNVDHELHKRFVEHGLLHPEHQYGFKEIEDLCLHHDQAGFSWQNAYKDESDETSQLLPLLYLLRWAVQGRAPDDRR